MIINTDAFHAKFTLTTIGLMALIITGCANLPTPLKPQKLNPNDTAQSTIITDTNHFQFGAYSSSAWVSESFTGQHSRQFQNDHLFFKVSQIAPEGGLDVGLSRSDYNPQTVLQAKTDLRACSTYRVNLSGVGRWWAGPKVSVNWQGDEAAKENGDDWYENYIVEIASSTPDELHEIYTGDYFKGDELPSSQLAGSTYRHYKIRFHSWWQFWSVRQDYRESGTLPIEPIVNIWIEHGLPADRTFDGVKANIETYGPLSGNGTLRMNTARDKTTLLSCE